MISVVKRGNCNRIRLRERLGLEKLSRDFKVNMTNLLKKLVGIVDNMYEHMESFSREIKILKKNT